MTEGPLVESYDLVIFDLDGVLYLVDEVIPGAVEAVDRLRRAGLPLTYATNNASRSAAAVAELLTSLGIPAAEEDVLTSAGATAAVLAERLPAGAPVLVVGAPALEAEVRAVGLRPVSAAEDGPAAVVQGYGPAVGWAQLAEACVAVRGGADWYATNTDRTLPSPRGPLPGNGSMVAALRTALGRGPDAVVGKPDPALFAQAARARGARRALVVGDRLDTDIEGAVRAGMDSLLVLTGVSGPAELLQAPPERRPTMVATDLAGLFAPAAATAVPTAAVPGWQVRRAGAHWILAGDGSPVDALRALCAALWDDPDRPTATAGGAAPPGDGAGPVIAAGNGAVPVIAADRAAAAALRDLGLPVADDR